MQVQEAEGHAVEDQKQTRTSRWWIDHEVLQSWLINTVKSLVKSHKSLDTVYHLLVKNNKEEGRGREGGL